MYRRIFSSFAGLGSYRPFIRPNFRLISSTSVRYKKNTNQARQESPIEVFFAKHPEFNHNINGQVWDEFNALCAHYKWKDSDIKKDQARHAFKKALVAEFQKLYGTNSKSIQAWKTLCKAIRISPIPDDIKECREKVLAMQVNLVDLLDCVRTGKPVDVFPDLEALREYTKTTEKYFPPWKASGPLRYLLRNIL